MALSFLLTAAGLGTVFYVVFVYPHVQTEDIRKTIFSEGLVQQLMNDDLILRFNKV